MAVLEDQPGDAEGGCGGEQVGEHPECGDEASDDASFVTGLELYIAGGYVAADWGSLASLSLRAARSTRACETAPATAALA